MKYYYFGYTQVYVFAQPTTDFEALTKKQIAFYEQCQVDSYNPTLGEVRDCKRDVVEFDLSAHKEAQITRMSMLSLNVAEQAFPSYQRRNVELGIYSNSAELLILEKELIIELRNEFYRLKEAIETAESRQDVDLIADANRYEEIANKYNFKALRHEFETLQGI